MEIIIGVIIGLVAGFIIGIIIGLANGKKSITAKVKQILKKEKIDLNLDQVLDKKHAEKVKEDFFEIPTS
jgi:uncharacterized membrane-anchored protein YhcB (DUF1043 family)